MSDCLLNEMDIPAILEKATKSLEGILTCNSLLNPDSECSIVCAAVEHLGG